MGIGVFVAAKRLPVWRHLSGAFGQTAKTAFVHAALGLRRVGLLSRWARCGLSVVNASKRRTRLFPLDDAPILGTIYFLSWVKNIAEGHAA